ncbi:MAG: type III PLP-dependent enzyme [Rhodospirillales bacterium]|nr:type III PLP-dependent enzyme [Rhodospirillales bacterium]
MLAQGYSTLQDESRRFPDSTAVAMSLQPSYPVYCVRPELLEAQARRFISLFPGTVLYAVKCNPHPLVLSALYRGGIRHFDTASLPEIAQICETYDDAHAYFMHPVKSRAVIKSAHMVYGVRHFVIDHADELEKVLEETRAPAGGPAGAEGLTIIVRLATPPAEGTLYHLAAKFGAPPKEAAELLHEAGKRGCRTGLAFHVGSQCGDPKAYRQALNIVGETVEAAGAAPACVDVGGGFPASYQNTDLPPLEDYMAAIRSGLKDIKLSPTVEVFSEPGRAIVAAGCSLLTQVQLRKGDRLYINDGIYGSLSELVQVGIELPARLIRRDGAPCAETRAFTLNGPTCDSLDVLPGTFSLPADAAEGDWIEIDQLGAYSNALSTNFNGFHPSTFVEVHDAPPALEA